MDRELLKGRQESMSGACDALACTRKKSPPWAEYSCFSGCLGGPYSYMYLLYCSKQTLTGHTNW